MDSKNTSIVVLVTGILVVFAVLFLLILIIKCLDKLLYCFTRSSKDLKIFSDLQKTGRTKNVSEKNESGKDGDELIAVISAAVDEYFRETGKRYRIQSIKRRFYRDQRSDIFTREKH